MAATNEAKERLKDDVASLVRVRNRLTKTEDLQLPKILSMLLPRVMTKLEESLTIQWSVPDHDEDHRQLILSSIEHMNGIVNHGLERIRGNKDLDTAGIIVAVAPFLTSQSTVLGTWALAYIQGGLSRCSVNILPRSVVPNLIRFIDQYQSQRVASSANGVSSATTAIATGRHASSSWLFFDFMIMYAGLKPLIDWDMDCFEETSIRWHYQKSDSWERLASDEDVEAANLSGIGVLQLFLNLLLYQPGESQAHLGVSFAGGSIMTHRSHRSHQGHGFRGVDRNNVSEMVEKYMRYLKLIVLRYAIWPPGNGLFQGDNMEKALLLAILFSGQNSMHGRLAADFLNKFDSKERKDDKTSFRRFRTFRSKCSINLALALLIMMVGERQSVPLLEAFEIEHSQTPWTSILGQIPTEASQQRSALPVSVSARVVDFILRHPLAPIRTAIDKESMRLLMELTTLLASGPFEQRMSGNIFGIQLISTFLDHVSSAERAEENNPMADKSWMGSIIETTLGVAVDVISQVVEAGEADSGRFRTINRHELPGGVPAPFGWRQDADRMLITHRESQKRRRLGDDEATRARQLAYSLIERHIVHTISREERPFQLAAKLLRCAVHEDGFLQQSLATTSKALLDIFNGYAARKEWEKICPGQAIDGSPGSLQQGVVPLLPAMLDAACSDSVWPRLLVIDWASRFLTLIDPEASSYLLSFLKGDKDARVSSAAKKVASKASRHLSATKKNPPVPCSYSYWDQSSCEGQLELKLLLLSHVNHISHLVGDHNEKSKIILFDMKFSTKGLLNALELEKENTMNSSGADMMVLKSDCDGNGICGICYDETSPEDGMALDCGHFFCRDCWVQYVDSVKDQGKYDLVGSRCPEQNCKCRVLPSNLENVDNALAMEWDEKFFKAFVEYACQECPGPDCSFVATRNLMEDSQDVFVGSCRCQSCQVEFCFECGKAPHMPASCKALVEWEGIYGTSDFYVRKNSKPCPGCHAPIEKNQGCNHMTCRCGVEFCWLCLTLWNQHSGNHICNRYNPITDAFDDNQRRALFLSERYDAHLRSEAFAEGQYEAARRRPEKLIEMFSFLAEEDENIFNGALFTLCRSRRYLKNSYVASFGLRQNQSSLDILERYQGGLEMLTERLSQLTETNLHRLYMEKGESAVKNHFHGLGFFGASVSNYMDRFNKALAEIGAT